MGDVDEIVLFSYGTLRQPEVQLATFGRELDGWADSITGYELGTILITDPAVVATSGSDRHPVLRPSGNTAAQVPGVAFRITEDELAAADEYEVDDYRRVRVPLRSGVEAWVYVFAGAEQANSEATRAARLLTAERTAEALFQEVVERGLIAPGKLESVVSDQIRDLAAARFGTRRHWHKRIVRSGENTLEPYRQNPPDRAITDDDIVFLDFGPVFAEWEADFGRTYVLGSDPTKLRLRADLATVWAAGREYFEARPEITGAQLYARMTELAQAAGWEFGGPHSGHLVGEFPHELIDGERIESYIAPGNTTPMRRLDRAGRVCHWILEVHLVDRERRIGGFFEQLLTLRHAEPPSGAPPRRPEA